jgi:Concanavalin A-like lectin/glucanases superfamily
MIGGVSPVPYHDYVSTLEAAAANEGWTKIRSWSLACGNTIDLWSKPARQAAGHRWFALFGVFFDVSYRPNQFPYEAAVLADSPEVYWRLGDKGCTAEDASGYDTTSIGAGHPEFGAPSLIADRNTAVHLDGKDDEYAFGPSTNSTPAKAISVEAWVRPDQTPTSPGAGWQLVTKWNTALLFLNGGPRPKFVFALAEPEDALYKPRVTGKVTVKPSTVYHVVGTYDGSKIRIYVNGTLAGAVTYKKGLEDPDYGGALAYAGWGTLPSPHFHGTLDEVAIYDHALTPKRIETHYRVGTGAAGR